MLSVVELANGNTECKGHLFKRTLLIAFVLPPSEHFQTYAKCDEHDERADYVSNCDECGNDAA